MLADMAAVGGGYNLTAWSAIKRQAGNCEATILQRSRIGRENKASYCIERLRSYSIDNAMFKAISTIQIANRHYVIGTLFLSIAFSVFGMVKRSIPSS
jgi:hypothetical protein